VRGLGIAVGILTGVALVAYPMFVYWAFTRWEPRYAALTLLVILAPVAVMRVRKFAGDVDRSALKAMAIVPVVAFVAFGLGAALNSTGAVLAAPVAINLVLLAAFGSTLRRGSQPMIERFARLTVKDLAPAELRWCRGWTWVWCGLFVVNAVAAAVLALYAPLSWWTVYNGLVAYILMGVLFAAEYVPRKLKFGRWGDHLLDRTLMRLTGRTGDSSP